MSSECFVTQLPFFPDITWFRKAVQAKTIEIGTVHNRKEWHLNRYQLSGKTGKVVLSVPLLGGRNQRCLVEDVPISYTAPWQRTHLRTIDSMYRKAPFFEHYFPYVEKIYQQKFEFLHQLNANSFEWLQKASGYSVELQKTANAFLPEKLTPTEFTYWQVYSITDGFISNCSVLDLLFCEGKAGVVDLVNTSLD